MKPRILLTSRVESNDQKKRVYVNGSYVDALYMAGASCAMLPYADQAIIDEYVGLFDGLLVTGGEDTDSRYFNEPMHPTAIVAPPFIDETDILLIRAFYQAKKPILGICRGLQIINVALGGSLIQDIESQYENIAENAHRQNKRVPVLDMHEFAHDVHFVKGTMLHEIFGDVYPVNSYHHQALNVVCDDLTVSGYSMDGIIEAAEKEGLILAVQWHPERLVHDDRHLEVFRRFVAMCQK